MHKNITIACTLFFISLPFQIQALSFQGMEAYPTEPNGIRPTYFVHESLPGQSITDKLTVINHSNTTISTRVYATDMVINNQGDEVAAAYESERKEFAKWVSFNNKEEIIIDLGPGEKTVIDFVINIPENTAHQEYRGTIMAEKLNTKDEALDSGITIRSNARIGIKTFLTVTDNPREIPKLADLPKKPADWRQTYFYVSLGIFVVAVGILAAGYLKKRRHHKGAAHHPEKHRDQPKK